MIINLNIDTSDPLDEHEKVILLALAGEIRLSETRGFEVETDDLPPETPAEAFDRAMEDEAARDAEPEPEAPAEEPKAKRAVNVSEESLKKYGFHQDEDGQVVCDHCDFVSETGRALHLHANTHKDEADTPKEKPLQSVPTPSEKPEAGVSAFTSTAPDTQDVQDAEKAAAGDPDPEPVAEVPEPVEAKVVETDPKVLRDTVAKVATEMVADNKQDKIREVINELGAARVSMVAEEDLQKFLDHKNIREFIDSKKG